MKNSSRLMITFGALSLWSLFTLALLLVLPCFALKALVAALGWCVLAGIPAVASVCTFLVYRSDKRRAELGKRRIPESTLHLIELLCGWPGAFLAQRAFRHKVSKVSYQVRFWIIVLLYQLVALDFLTDWKLSQGLWHLVQSRVG